ncbi:hypothetical protein MP638_003603 [Amoeboaphelidium occidentale]|nr:hypothetical protein MP638_003603 [Amoeboaphelidium occidentale]
MTVEPLEHEKSEEHSTTDSAIRYIGYSARVKTILFSAKRYLAYSSDFGEAFRPVVQKRVVNAAYALSWGYVLYDVSTEGYKSYQNGDSPSKVTETVVKRGIFQSLASMILPAITIHTQVHLFQKITQRIGKFQKWGPTMAGLALVPALPFLFDHPIEHAVDAVFDRITLFNSEEKK